ncbi:MAG: thioredoxin [Christensenellaceae bacterium]
MVQHCGSREEFEAIVSGATIPVVCDFSATWCGPCRMLAPVYDKVAAELKGRAIFLKIDIDECEELAALLQISAVPTVMVVEREEEVARTLGFMPASQLKEFIEQYI